MQFWKMNGAGNDFIILNNLQEGLSADCFPALARRLCERRLSIGADGLMVVERPQSGGDYRMLFYNSDGSAGEMCGNGARCICRYGYEIGLAGELQRVETTAGLVTGRRITRRQYKIELNRPTTLRLDYPVEVDGKTYPCSYVELGYPGLPHAVVPIPGLRGRPEAELFALGRKLRAIIYQKLGLNPAIDYGAAAIGIMNMTPPESAVIAADIAVKSGDVYLGFADRFTGTVIITGELADVTSALTEIVNYFRDELGYVVCRITKR